MLALLGPAGVVDGGDVGMLEARQGLDLALEQPDVRLVHEAATADDLERHPAPRLLLLRLVDDPHAPFAELAENAEGAEHPWGTWWGTWGGGAAGGSGGGARLARRPARSRQGAAEGGSLRERHRVEGVELPGALGRGGGGAWGRWILRGRQGRFSRCGRMRSVPAARAKTLRFAPPRLRPGVLLGTEFRVDSDTTSHQLASPTRKSPGT